MKNTSVGFIIGIGMVVLNLTIAPKSLALPYCYEIGGATAWTLGDEPTGQDALYLLYKAEVDGNNPSQSEEGPAAAWFRTVFANNPVDPKNHAVICWDRTAFTPEITDVWLKVGSGDWMHAAIGGTDLGAFNGLKLNNPDPDHGISHVSLYARTGVPEGGATVMLLGLALAGLGAFQRRFGRK